MLLLGVVSLSQDTDAVQVTLTDDDSSSTLEEIDDIEETDELVNMNLEGMWEQNMEESGSSDDSTADEIMIVDLDEELRDLIDIYEDMEDFETVTIDGVEYTKEEVAEMIKELEAEIEETELIEAALDVDILYFFREEEGNIVDYEQGFAAVEYLLTLMDDTDIVVIDLVEYTKAEIEALVAEADKEKNDSILSVAADAFDALELGETEDSIETYIDALTYLLSWMDDETAIKLAEGPFEIDELETMLEDAKALLEDLDEGNELADEIADVEEQFLVIDTTIDDYLDENEEIEEIIENNTDPIIIFEEEYSNDELIIIIDENNAAIQDLEVLAKCDEIMLLFEDKEEELRLSIIDFDQGMEAVEELIAMMESTDVAVLDGDSYTKAELQELVDTAKKYNNSQNLLSSITDVEENILSDPPTSEEIEDEIALLNEVLKYMSEGQVAVIDGVNYSVDEIGELIADLEALLVIALNDEALANELGDVQFLLEMYEGSVTADDLEVLVEELEELLNEMQDGDVLMGEDGDEIDEEDVEDIISDTSALIDEVPEDGELEIDEDDSVNQLSDAFLP